jgi:hypothetical protein
LVLGRAENLVILILLHRPQSWLHLPLCTLSNSKIIFGMNERSEGLGHPVSEVQLTFRVCTTLYATKDRLHPQSDLPWRSHQVSGIKSTFSFGVEGALS